MAEPAAYNLSENESTSEHARHGNLSDIQLPGEPLTPLPAPRLAEVAEPDQSTAKPIYRSNASRTRDEAGSDIVRNGICAPITISAVSPTPAAIAEAENNTAEDTGPLNTSRSREETCSEDARRGVSPTEDVAGASTDGLSGSSTEDLPGSWYTLPPAYTVRPADSAPFTSPPMSASQPEEDSSLDNAGPVPFPKFGIADEFFSLGPALPLGRSASSPPPPPPSYPPPPVPRVHVPAQHARPVLTVNTNTDITPYPLVSRPVTPLLPPPLYNPYVASGPFPPSLYDPTSPHLPSFIQRAPPPPTSPSSSDTSSTSDDSHTPRRLDPAWPTVLKGYINSLPYPWIDSVLRVEAKFLSPRLPDIKHQVIELLGRGKTTTVFAVVAKPKVGSRGMDGGRQGKPGGQALRWGGQAIALKRYRNADSEHNKGFFTIYGTDFFRDLATELRILDQLDHRHIVTLLGVFRRRNIPGLILAPAAVCDLEDFLDSFVSGEQGGGVPSLWKAFEFSSPFSGGARSDADTDRNKHREREGAEQVFATAHAWLLSHTACLLSALESIHDQKICHRDVRAENVLLTHDRVYLCDFGGSKDYKPPKVMKAKEQPAGGESSAQGGAREGSAQNGQEGPAPGGSAVPARPSKLGVLYDRELARIMPQWNVRTAMKRAMKRDVLMLCGVFLEMALARDYDARAVMGQDWEAVWTDGDADLVIEWAKRVKALREGKGVGNGGKLWGEVEGEMVELEGMTGGVTEGPKRALLKVVEVVALFAIQGWLMPEEVRGWIGGNEAAMRWLVRECCDGEEVGADEGGGADGGGDADREGDAAGGDDADRGSDGEEGEQR